jgi:hypothetical protein
LSRCFIFGDPGQQKLSQPRHQYTSTSVITTDSFVPLERVSTDSVFTSYSV